MTPQRDEVAYVLPDKLGGVFNYVGNLLAHRSDRLCAAAVRTDNAYVADPTCDEPLPADREIRFSYSLPPENLYSVLRRLARVFSGRPGVIVANDWIELALTAAYDTGRAVVAITHGDFDYYYDLAVRHQDTIDAYVTYSERMFQRLRELLPGRHDTIFLLPYGVSIPTVVRHAAEGPLRLLYVGRLTRTKGVFDLPAIDARLHDRGVEVTWTIQGSGPDEAALKTAWSHARSVRWTGRQPMADVLRLYASHDVLVMPSRHEGLPVALLEAGAAGVVPVASNLASGIPDVVQPGITGYRPEPGDLDGFTEAIASLAAARERLEAMSRGVRERVVSHYDASTCTAAYERLFADWRRWKRERPTGSHLSYGSRLDQPWLPNRLVCALRSARVKS